MGAFPIETGAGALQLGGVFGVTGILAAGGGEIAPMIALLSLVLAAVVLVSLVLIRFKQSLLVGYFLCGVVLANSGVLERMGEGERATIEVLAQLGVVLLMFTIGVEFSVAEMKKLRRVALWGGGWQVGLVTLVAGGVALWFGAAFPVALALGIAVALSSTAVSIKSFQDMGMPDSPGARVALGIAIFQDVFVIFFIILLPPLLGVGDGGMAGEVGLAMVKGAIFLGACWFLSRRGIPQLLHAVAQTQSRELFTITVVALCTAIAYGAILLDLNPALGAFAAGLVASESIYSHRVLADILPFKDLFLTIFFVSVGLLLDLGAVAENWVWVAGGTAAILTVKFMIGLFAARQLGVGLRPALFAAASLASTGEFSLILLDRISDLGELEENAFQVLLACTAIGMGLVPALMRMAGLAGTHLQRKGWLQRKECCPAELLLRGEVDALSDHVIICGYGPVGRNLHLALEKYGIPILIIEMNAETVRELIEDGVKVLFADARQPEVLEMAGVKRARGIAFTFPDADTALIGMRLARQKNPEIHVYARAKFAPEADRLREAGVDYVIHDEQESGQAMMKIVVGCYAPEEVLVEWRG